MPSATPRTAISAAPAEATPSHARHQDARRVHCHQEREPSHGRQEDIQLYTIGFQVTSASKALLKSCASKPDMFYDSPTNEQLAGIFQDIAQGLSELRIAQ